MSDDQVAGVIAYDSKGQIFYGFADHIDYLLQVQHLSPKSIDMVCSHLGRYFSHLERLVERWEHADDSVLRSFRDAELQAVLVNKSCRGLLSAKRTVNYRLRYVYQFYFWAQELAHLVADVIGQGRPIESSLTGLSDKTSRYRRTRLDRNCYPICFDLIGTASRFRPNVYTATHKDVVDITSTLIRKADPKAQRDLLILDIADSTGMRAESIVSLSTADFEDPGGQKDQDFVTLVPRKQKFGAQHPFDFPMELYLRIQRYIKVDRAQILVDRRKTEKQARFALFLNVRRGTPIKTNSVVHIFSKELRILGAPKGAGAHSFRRKRAEDITEVEVEARRIAGQPVMAVDVAFAVARELGHSTLGAQAAYVKQMHSELSGESFVDKANRERRELTRRVRKLEEENASLRKNK